MEWYYILDGERFGPVREDELRAMIADGRLEPDSLVWNESMGEDWAEVNSVPKLAAPSPQPEAELPADPYAPLEPEQPAPPPLDQVAIDGTAYDGSVSCTTPFGRAWARMVRILFSPFDIGKWFALGLSAWLATWDEGRGGGNFRVPNTSGGGPQQGSPDPDEVWQKITEFTRNIIEEMNPAIAIAVVVGVLIFIVLGLVMLWLNSRGKLMFLDNVLKNRAEISEAWHDTQQPGNSLFRWNIGFGIVCFLALALLIALIVLTIVVPCMRANGFAPAALPAIILLTLAWIIFAIVAGAIRRFRDDFVVPIMYSTNSMCTAAWGQFLGLMRPQLGAFVVYLLFRLLLSIGAAFGLLVVALITCCVGGCLFSLPYIGAVILLPVHVFFRAYSLEYLAQFGEEYRLFTWR